MDAIARSPEVEDPALQPVRTIVKMGMIARIDITFVKVDDFNQIPPSIGDV